ncbi:MAG: EamA family transporter [Rhodobacterales bacterium]|nr:EamA family transporter [Rhodobacterales bacterium]
MGLAALVLGETISPVAGLGMAAIAAAFALLVRQSLRHPQPRPDGHTPGALDYGWGAAAALAYAGAYVTRKLGLETLPAPALGTLVSALTGLAVFAARAAVDARQRDHLLGLFRYLDRWSAGAGVLMSLGQVSLFAALLYESVQVIVMISSLDIFFAAFLAVVVLKTERRPDRTTLLAAVAATLGVVLVALG